MRRIFWILITPIFFFLIFATLFNFILWPKIAVFIQQEVKKYSEIESQIPVLIQIGEVKMRWLRPALILGSVSIQPKKEIEKILSPTEIEEIRLQIDPFQILLGRLTLSALTIDGIKSELNIDPLMEGNSRGQELPLEKVFKKLDQVPVDRFFLEKINISLNSKNFGGSLTLKDSSLGLLFQPRKLQIRTSIKQAEMDFKKYGKGSLGIETLLQLTPKALKILQFETSLNKNKINVEGQLDNFHRIQLHPKGTLNVKTSLDLSDLFQQIKSINSSWKLPPIEGEVHSDGQIKIDTFDQLSGEFHFNTRDVKVQAFEIGNAQLSGEFKNRSLIINKIEAVHPAGRVVLKKTDLELTQEFKFKTEVEIQDLDLQKLFQTLRLKNVPVEVMIQGQLPCTGKLDPFLANCEGWINGKNIHVNSKGNFSGKPIVRVDEIAGVGKLEVDMKQVSYKADVKVANDVGQTDGVIIFNEGFKINYKTPELSFDNIKSLANLNLHGLTSIEGSTQGNSHAATFTMNLHTKRFEFENYQLGDFSTQLAYKEGHLTLKEIEGLLSRSSFQGQLDINFHNNEIMGQMDFPRTDLADVAWIFDQVYQFPLSVNGAGQARLRFEGPLNFWKLNYKVESNFTNGKIGTESFGKIQFNA